MKDQNLTQQVVAVAGAVVGAGIAVAGLALSDKKNRDKIVDASHKMKTDTIAKMDQFKEELAQNKMKVNGAIKKDSEAMQKVVKSAISSLDATTKKVNKAIKTI